MNKISLNETKRGGYYRFHYDDGYVIGKVNHRYMCYFGIKDEEISDENAFWDDKPCFSAAHYCTLATDIEIQWLDYCVENQCHITKATFIEEVLNANKEKSNYSIF